MPRMGTQTRYAPVLFFAGLLVSLGAVAPLAATGHGGFLPRPFQAAVTPMQAAAPPAIVATVDAARREKARQAVEKLREMSDAVGVRITGVPNRPCSLSVEWQRYTMLMDDVLSRLTEESDSREFEHARFVLGEIDKFITMTKDFNAEACADYASVAATKHSVQQHLVQAGSHLLGLAAAIQGDKFPFAKFDDFQTFYRAVKWREHPSLYAEIWMHHLRTPLEQIYGLVKRHTSVNRGQVRIRLPRGEQTVGINFDKGSWVPIFGDSLQANRLYWSVSESLPRGAALYTKRFNWNCSGRSSAYSCHGSLRELKAGEGRYRLSAVVSHQMRSALQQHVTAACKRTIANPEAMRYLAREHRPTDKQVGQAYDGIAERFLANIALVARSGGDRLCSSTQELMDSQLERAIASWSRALSPVVPATNVYEKFRARLQRLLDLAGYRILEYTPPFGGAADAAAHYPVGTERAVVDANSAHEEEANTRSAGLFGVVLGIANSAVSASAKRRSGARLEAVDPTSAFSRASNTELPPLVRARAAALAARGFAAVVEANLAGNDTSEAIAARLSALDAARDAKTDVSAAEAAAEAGWDRAIATAATRAVRAARKAKAVAERDYDEW